jgi:hypothetical protein
MSATPPSNVATDMSMFACCLMADPISAIELPIVPNSSQVAMLVKTENPLSLATWLVFGTLRLLFQVQTSYSDIT